MRRPLAVLAVAGVLAAWAPMASAATGFNQATFTTQSVTPKRLTAPVQMTKDEQGPARAFTGPTSMLVDPGNPRVLVAATADLRTRVCQLLVSGDAGHTWHFSKSLPAPRPIRTAPTGARAWPRRRSPGAGTGRCTTP